MTVRVGMRVPSSISITYGFLIAGQLFGTVRDHQLRTEFLRLRVSARRQFLT